MFTAPNIFTFIYVLFLLILVGYFQFIVKPPFTKLKRLLFDIVELTGTSAWLLALGIFSIIQSGFTISQSIIIVFLIVVLYILFKTIKAYKRVKKEESNL